MEPSEKSFRRAIELDPNRSDSYNHFAMNFLLPLGRIKEALKQLRLAAISDPLSSGVHERLAYVLTSGGRYDEAARHCEKLPPYYPAKSECLGRARLGQGRIGETIQVLAAAFDRGVSPGSLVRGFLGYAYARAGRRQEAEKLAAATSSQNPFNQALIFAGLSDKDSTFAALDRAAVTGPFRIGRALTFPEFALLRGDSRVQALRKKVGLRNRFTGLEYSRKSRDPRHSQLHPGHSGCDPAWHPEVQSVSIYEPRQPILLITSAAWPFTVTATGEFTSCRASKGNG